MRSATKAVVIVLSLVAVMTASAVLADEGRTPIWQPVTIGPGGEGKYFLSRDITAPAAGPAIDILPGTVAVEIDLNGFTIFGGPSSVIQARAIDSLTVRNGTIMFGGSSGGQAGVYAEQVRKVVVEEMKIQFIEGSGIGMFEVATFSVRNNVIVNCQLDGIFSDGFWIDPAIPTEGTIEDNVIRECGGGVGILNGSTVGIKDNRIETLQASGIFIDSCAGCLIEGNTIDEATGQGMELMVFAGGKIYNNVATGSVQGHGIWLQEGSDDNLVLNNVCSRNGNNGLLIDSSQNHVEGNVLNSNGLAGLNSWGLYFGGAGNVYRGNMARGNPGPGAACPGFPATTDFCDATGGLNTSPLNQPPTLVGDNLMPGLL
jgi:parallel beta-helix repeat protein